jgi:transposase
MRKIKEVLRLKAAGHGNRAIARSLGIAHSTVREYLSRAATADLEWPLTEDVSDTEIEARLFPPPRPSNLARPLPDWAEVQRELKAKKHVTLQLLWLEYKEDQPDGLQYSQFCELYRRWSGCSRTSATYRSSWSRTTWARA